MEFKQFQGAAKFEKFVLKGGASWTRTGYEKLVEQVLKARKKLRDASIVVLHPDTAAQVSQVLVDSLHQFGFETQVNVEVKEITGFWLAKLSIPIFENTQATRRIGLFKVNSPISKMDPEQLIGLINWSLSECLTAPNIIVINLEEANALDPKTVAKIEKKTGLTLMASVTAAKDFYYMYLQ